MIAAVNASLVPCTPHQRMYARTLMNRLELSTWRFTATHRPVFAAAHLDEPTLGSDVETYLRALTKAQASTLISVLLDRLGEGGGE